MTRLLRIDPRQECRGEQPARLLEWYLPVPLPKQGLQFSGGLLACDRMKDILGMGGNNSRIGIHQIPEIRHDALPLDHQLLLHEPHRLGIIIPEKPGQSITLRRHS